MPSSFSLQLSTKLFTVNSIYFLIIDNKFFSLKFSCSYLFKYRLNLYSQKLTSKIFNKNQMKFIKYRSTFSIFIFYFRRVKKYFLKTINFYKK